MGVGNSNTSSQQVLVNGETRDLRTTQNEMEQEEENMHVANVSERSQQTHTNEAGNRSDQADHAVTTTGTNNPQSSPPVWCLIKSKTRQHNSSKETKQSYWFEARNGSVFTIGRDKSCDLCLEDDRCESLNARIISKIRDGKQCVYLHPESRMYRLIGMRGKNSQPQILSIGSVIKVGSISLEVTDLCTDVTDDFADRFAVEIGKCSKIHALDGKDRSLEDAQDNNHVEKGKTESKEEHTTSRSESAIDSDGTAEREADQEIETSEHNAMTENKKQVDDDAMCYICWGGLSIPTDVNKTNQTSRSKSGDLEIANEETNDRVEGETAAEEKLIVQTRQNPLIRNPCGNCSGCSQYVHLQCLLTWIKKSGSGHCSICNGVLPSHFASPPPNLELKIVRHRRGHSWVGTRRFRLSFADCDQKFIGKRSTADVRLPDRSVGDLHAKIKFDGKNKQFLLSDNSTTSGTFLQIGAPLELGNKSGLANSASSDFKIGRTNLSIKIAQKRGTLLNMMQLRNWARRTS